MCRIADASGDNSSAQDTTASNRRFEAWVEEEEEDSRARELIPFAREGFILKPRHETRFSRGENFSRLNSRCISTGYLICFSQQNNRHILARDRELNALRSAINGEEDKTARASRTSSFNQ